MKKIELVIFDMDGLIFDTEKLSYKSWIDAAKKLNVPFTDNIFYKLLGTNLASIRKTLEDEFEENVNVEKYIDEKRNLYREMIKDGAEKKEGIDELLKYLKDNNIKRAVATSSKREVALELLSKAKIDDKFDYILCGDEIEKSKPDPEVFLKVANKIGVDPKYCMVLEDSEAGTLAASRAKMTPIIIPDLKEPISEIESLAYKKLNNLKEVIEVLESFK